MTPPLDQPTAYTTLSCREIAARLTEVAVDAPKAFGHLDRSALNWRPEPARWSVAQCLEHLLTTNRLMLQAAAEALDGSAPRNPWRHVPFLPRIVGPMMIRSQAPSGTRTFTAPPQARPAASDIAPDIIGRFVEQHRRAAEFIGGADEAQAARVIMTSPFLRLITYTVLDGWRLIVAHDHRHLEQARRVTQWPGFPEAFREA